MEEEEPYGDQDGLNGDQNMDGRAGQGDEEDGDGEGVSVKFIRSGRWSRGRTNGEERERLEGKPETSRSWVQYRQALCLPGLELDVEFTCPESAYRLWHAIDR